MSTVQRVDACSLGVNEDEDFWKCRNLLKNIAPLQKYLINCTQLSKDNVAYLPFGLPKKVILPPILRT
jgi:hypothetical protein